MPDWPEWLPPGTRYCCACGKRVTNKTGFMAYTTQKYVSRAGREEGVTDSAWVTCLACVGSQPQKKEDSPKKISKSY